MIGIAGQQQTWGSGGGDGGGWEGQGQHWESVGRVGIGGSVLHDD